MPSEQLILQSSSPLSIFIMGLLYVLLILGGTVAAVTLMIRSRQTPIPWAEHITWLRARPWTWVEGLSVIGLTGLLIGLGWIISALLKHPHEGMLIIIQGITLDLAGIGVIVGFMHSRGWNWRETFGYAPVSLKLVKWGCIYYLTLIPFTLVSSLVYQGILSAKGYPQNLQDIAILLSGDYPVWMRVIMFLFAIVVAPIFEECLFRGVLLPIAVRQFGLGAGVFLISAIFAGIHLNLASFIPLFIVASGFSLAYLRTKSLWVPIMMHGLFNGVNLTLLIALRQ